MSEKNNNNIKSLLVILAFIIFSIIVYILWKENNRRKTENIALTEQINFLNVQLKNSEKRIDSLEAQTKSLQFENRQLHETIVSLNRKKDSLNDIVSDVRATNKDQRQRIQELGHQIDLLGQTIVSLNIYISNDNMTFSSTNNRVFPSDTKRIRITFKTVIEMDLSIIAYLRKGNEPVKFFKGYIEKNEEGSIDIDLSGPGEYSVTLTNSRERSILRDNITFIVATN